MTFLSYISKVGFVLFLLSTGWSKATFSQGVSRSISAVDDFDSTLVNTPLSFDVLANDSVVDRNFTSLVTSFSFGSTNYQNGIVQYTPNQNFSGIDTLTYVVCDDASLSTCDTAIFVVTVLKVEAFDDFDSTLINEEILVDVLQNDQYSFFTSLRIVCSPQNGSIQLNSTPPSIFYSPNNNYSGSDEFCYELCMDLVCDTARVFIEVNRPPSDELQIPNGFSPNNDGRNDFFVIGNFPDEEQVQLEIYNRWGEVVYQSVNYQNDWDGENRNGEKLASNTYFYFISVNSKEYKGYVVLQR